MKFYKTAQISFSDIFRLKIIVFMSLFILMFSASILPCKCNRSLSYSVILTVKVSYDLSQLRWH